MSISLDRRSFGLGLAAVGAQGLRSFTAARADAPYLVSEKRIALVAANWKYKFVPCVRGSPSCNLNSPQSNAEAIGSALKKLGFDVRTVFNLDQDALTKEVANFFRVASISNTAVMYYAGHGLQYERENYLVPVDAKIEGGYSVEQACVPVSWATENDWNADSVGIVLLDACRENPFIDPLRKNRDYPRQQIRDGLAPTEPPGYFLISYATGADKFAKDGDSVGLSPYARAILDQIGNPDLSIQDAFARVTDAVCNLTSPAAAASDGSTVQCQRPAVYSNLGAAPLFFAKASVPRRFSSSPLLVNLKMADPSDPAVDRLLGKVNDEFAFKYLWLDGQKPGDAAQIIPNIDYFTSAAKRGRPFIVAKPLMYYSPQEKDTTLWSLSSPIVDLIARKLSPNAVHIESITVEAAESRPDNAPYVGLVVEQTAPNADESKSAVGRLLLVNGSWQQVKSVTLEFDVIGQRDWSDKDAEDWVGNREPGRFKCSISVNDIGDFTSVDLVNTLKVDFPDIVHYLFASGKDVSVDEKGTIIATKLDSKSNQVPVAVSDEFAAWYKQQPRDQEPDPLWIGGQMTSLGADGEKVTVDFAAPIPLLQGEAGNGEIKYDLIDFIELPIDGKPHAFPKSINMVLNDEKRTFRGLFPLTSKQSSYHKVRFTLRGERNLVLYQSAWADAHIVISPNDKKAVAAARRGRGWASFVHKVL